MPKVLYTKEGEKYYIRDASKDYHFEYGYFKAADLAREGKIVSNTGKECFLSNVSFIDQLEKIKRLPQVIPLKDVGLIISKAGIGKKSVIVDAGTGSCYLALVLANIAKKVTSYELREDFHTVAKENKEKLGMRNLTLKRKSIYDGIDEKNVDVLTLDLPEPWNAIAPAKKALKIGGFIVSYSPTIPQVMDFVKAVGSEPSLLHLETIEILERQWEVDERKVRPKSQQIGHSGFLVFVRKIDNAQEII